MNDNYLRWITIKYDELNNERQWNTMRHNEMQWNRMENNEMQWNTMKCEEILALDFGFGVVNYIGIQWNSLKYNGLRWNTMQLYGKQ